MRPAQVSSEVIPHKFVGVGASSSTAGIVAGSITGRDVVNLNPNWCHGHMRLNVFRSGQLHLKELSGG